MTHNMNTTRKQDSRYSEKSILSNKGETMNNDSWDIDISTYQELSLLLSSLFVINMTNKITDSMSDRFSRWPRMRK